MSRVLQIKEAQDIPNLLSSYRIVVIDSYAEWCYPCKVMEPKYEELAAKYSSNDVCFAKCDSELNLIKVRGLPSIDIHVNGAFYTNITGADIKRLEDVLKQVAPMKPQNKVQIGQPQLAQSDIQPQPPKPKPNTKKGGGGYKSYGSYWN